MNHYKDLKQNKKLKQYLLVSENEVKDTKVSEFSAIDLKTAKKIAMIFVKDFDEAYEDPNFPDNYNGDIHEGDEVILYELNTCTKFYLVGDGWEKME